MLYRGELNAVTRGTIAVEADSFEEAEDKIQAACESGEGIDWEPDPFGKINVVYTVAYQESILGVR